MASAAMLRDDFDGAGLRSLARLSGDANQVRRLLALAVTYDGGARRAAAQVGGVGLQTVRDWVLRFNARGPAGLLDGEAPRPRPALGAEHERALAEIIEQDPIPASHGVVRWRIVDLMQWLFDEYGVWILGAEKHDYNTVRPHSKLGGRTPAEVAGQRGWGHGPNPVTITSTIKAKDSTSERYQSGVHVITRTETL